jgi:hypothetical protein
MLNEILRARRKQGKETYCCFLDIRKAYDKVFRDGLWSRLLEAGLRGKLWRVLRNLYSIVESCVLVGDERTDWFPLDEGLRQGCILSPILFAIFIDGMARVVKHAKTREILEKLKLNILLFADDALLIASSPKELQFLLDRVFQYSQKWRFKFNSEKSKVLVFKGRKPTGKACVFFLGLQRLEIVESIKYLGVDFAADWSWLHMKERLVKKAKARLACVSKAINEGLTLDSGENLWRTLVRPILEYACEVWASGKWPEAERIQLEAGRKLLGVGGRTTGEAVRGELGWWTLQGRRDLCRLRFFGKIARLGSERLLKRVFLTCKAITGNMPTTWCGKTRQLLFELGLGHIWSSGEVGSAKDWEKVAFHCIEARERREWKRGVEKKDKLRLYRVLKTELRREAYLTLPLERRRRFTELRCGTHGLRIETGRWDRIAKELRYCRVCVCGPVEDELHVLLDCYPYRVLREQLIASIRTKTGYDLSVMWGDRDWLRDFLLGCGVSDRKTRITVTRIVGTFLNRLIKRREEILLRVSAN